MENSEGSGIAFADSLLLLLVTLMSAVQPVHQAHLSSAKERNLNPARDKFVFFCSIRKTDGVQL